MSEPRERVLTPQQAASVMDDQRQHLVTAVVDGELPDLYFTDAEFRWMRICAWLRYAAERNVGTHGHAAGLPMMMDIVRKVGLFAWMHNHPHTEQVIYAEPAGDDPVFVQLAHLEGDISPSFIFVVVEKEASRMEMDIHSHLASKRTGDERAVSGMGLFRLCCAALSYAGGRTAEEELTEVRLLNAESQIVIAPAGLMDAESAERGGFQLG